MCGMNVCSSKLITCVFLVKKLSIAKMRNIDIRWVGEMALKNEVYENIFPIIGELTKEHDGNVRALVWLQNTKRTGKVPLLLFEELYLGVFSENYGLFLPMHVLDVKELIFMYDNDIVEFRELAVFLNLDKLF